MQGTWLCEPPRFFTKLDPKQSNIRHICIPFPTQLDRARLHEAHVKNLELVRRTCINIRTLELLDSPDCSKDAFINCPIVAESFGLLDMRLKNISSIKEVVINFEVYPEQDPRNDLTKMIHNYGWTVKVTKLTERKGTSQDDGLWRNYLWRRVAEQRTPVAWMSEAQVIASAEATEERLRDWLSHAANRLQGSP